MPITLGCPSCGKRFRARDESAGKRVKCPYCAAAVPVPTAEQAAAAGAPTSVIPPVGAAQPAAPASPEAWGATPAPAPNPFAADATSASASPSPRRSEPKKAPARPAPKSAVARTPEQTATASWKRCRAGLCWVLFGLFWLTIPGFVGFGKLVYERSGRALPTGPADNWVKIPGYVNDGPNSILKTKEEQLEVALYAIPVVLGGLFLSFGRLTAGAAPRSSGASGLFAFSGLFTLLGLAGLVTAAACHKDRLNFPEAYYYSAIGFLVIGGLAEFWFLNGLSASGLALRRPAVARAVGLTGFCFALAAAIPTVGWRIYTDPQWKLRPSPLPEEWKLYEQAALLLGWLILIGVYWRAVRGVRVAIRDALESGTA